MPQKIYFIHDLGRTFILQENENINMGEKFEFLLHLENEKCPCIRSFCSSIRRRLIAKSGYGARFNRASAVLILRLFCTA
jgi:hypothetical protein